MIRLNKIFANLMILYIAIIFCIKQLHALNIYCISPNSTPARCSVGTSITNFVQTLSGLTRQDDVIFLLTNIQDDFFFFLKEISDSDNSILYDYTANPITIFHVKSLSIMPYYCSDYQVSSATDDCFENKPQKIRIYLKTEKFKINIESYMIFKDIIIDGSENILIFNQPYTFDITNPVTQCLYSKIFCCKDVNYDGVICDEEDLIISNLIANSGLFTIAYKYELNTIITPRQYLTITNSEFNNIYTDIMQSIFFLDTIDINLNFDTINIQNCFFPKGLITVSSTKPALATSLCQISTNNNLCFIDITIKNIIFNNLNSLKIFYQSSYYVKDLFFFILFDLDIIKHRLNVQNNVMNYTIGCLFIVDSPEPYNIIDSTFQNNNFNLYDNVEYDDPFNINMDIMSIFSLNYGLFCIDNPKQLSHNLVFSVYNTTFINNTGIVLRQYPTKNIMLNIDNSQFINNSNYDSAIIFLDYQNKDSIITNTYFSGNNGWYSTIYAAINIKAINNTYINNNGYHSFLLVDNSVTYNDSKSIIKGNNIGISGNYFYTISNLPQSATIIVSGSKYYCNSCYIINNKAYGGIYFLLSGSTATIENSIIQENKFFTNIDIPLTLIAFITSDSRIKLANCIISGHSTLSNFNGDELPLIFSSKGSITLEQSYVINNLIQDFGCFISAEASTLTITNSNFSENKVPDIKNSQAYGLIKATSTIINIKNTTFYRNINIITSIDSKLTIDLCIFLLNVYSFQNSDIGSRVLIYINFNTVSFTNSLIDEGNINFNVPSNIFIATSSTELFIQNVTIQNIISNTGSAISLSQSTISVNQLNLYNITIYDGKSIDIIGGTLPISINNSIFMSIGPHLSVEKSENLTLYLYNNQFVSLSNNNSVTLSNIKSISMINCKFSRSDTVTIQDTQTQQEDTENQQQEDNETPALTQTPTSNSAIYVQDIQILSITSCNFKNFFTSSGALEIYINENSFEFLITISTTTFLNNLAISGAAITIQNINGKGVVDITESIFTNNTALHKTKGLDIPDGKGGAIYFSSSQSANSAFFISGSSFISNNASIAGGAIFWDYMPFTNDSMLIFINNTAAYGPDIGSYAIRGEFLEHITAESTSFIVPYIKTYDLTYAFEQVKAYKNSINLTTVSNYPLMTTKYFVLLDAYNQVVNYDKTSTLTMAPIENVQQNLLYDYAMVISPQQLKCINGGYNMPSVRVSFYPNTASSLIIVSSALKKLPLSFIQTLTPELSEMIISELNPLEFTVNLHFTKCPIGSYFSQMSTNEKGYGICGECINGTYLLDVDPFPNNKGPCINCEYKYYESCSQAYLYLKAGYWKLNATADLVFSCDFPDACQGGMNTTGWSEYPCQQRYSGNLCNKCPPGQGKFGTEATCVDCATNVWYYIKLVLATLGQILLIGYSVKCTLATFGQGKTIEQEKAAVTKSNLIKILLNYFEAMTAIISMNDHWPTEYEVIIATTSSISMLSEFYFSIDCFVALGSKGRSISTVPMYYIKLLGVFVSPFIYSGLAWGFWRLYQYIKKTKIINNTTLKNNIMSTLVIIVYKIQPTLMESSFSLFQCNNLYRNDQRDDFLQKDYDIRCWTSSHMAWAICLGVNNILIWGVVAPGLVFRKLKRNVNNLDDPEIIFKYSFLFRGFREKLCYWDIIIMIRKLLIVIVTVFADRISKNFQVLMASVLMIIAYQLNVHFKPFDSKQMNRMEEIGLMSVCLLSFAVIYFQGEGKRSVDIIIFIIIIIGYIATAIYFFICFFNTSKNDIDKVKGIFQKLCEKCKKKSINKNKPKDYQNIKKETPNISISQIEISHQLDHNNPNKTSEINDIKKNKFKTITTKNKTKNEASSVSDSSRIFQDDQEEEKLPRLISSEILFKKN